MLEVDDAREDSLSYSRTEPYRTSPTIILDNQQLRLEMVERLDAHRSAMYRAVEKGGPAAYAVRRDRIERTWP
ncbi:hypothetical protein [Streptomyces sp. NBC_01481]|uniref:hypothetical protein n=1 Tax=Streptomyces sp. NBC_01481 TaxID=2975869 RepID=UPI00224CF6F1|nr:hypothetical protein [Streptomyces sp. NBC_01481]MCX4584514.1 hypothetical protein [Streptomyces sp. NBC_01481]